MKMCTKSKSFLIIATIINLSLAQNEMTFIGDAYEGFAPCDDFVLSMGRLIGGPPNLENYWDGSVYLDKWPTLNEVRISLTVDNPAKIEYDGNAGRISVRNQTFHITTFEKPPSLKIVHFTVRASPGKAFPNVERLTLNGADICRNPKKWSPTILGFGGNVTETEVADKVLPSCGNRLVQHKGLITNGFSTQEGEWPWHAAIYHVSNQQQQYKCGGTLIDLSTVLTAAHCVFENGRQLVAERILVQLGKHNLAVASTNTQEFQVFAVIPHEDFSTTDLRNDIAVLRLATETTPSNYVHPVCLWERNKAAIVDVIGRQGIVVGWGLTETDELSTILRQGRMPVVSLTTCLNSNRDFFGLFLSDTNFCAGFRNGTSVCNGDSGGGMFFESNGTYRIRGIVSLSTTRADKKVCNAKQYVLFTDVAQYLDWIATAMRQGKTPIPLTVDTNSRSDFNANERSTALIFSD